MQIRIRNLLLALIKVKKLKAFVRELENVNTQMAHFTEETGLVTRETAKENSLIQINC